METYERIRHLRKTVLKMTQDKFGAVLGVNRDMIANIEQNRLARPEQKEPIIKLISKEFNVSYEWLTTGVGDMFLESDATIVTELTREYGLSPLEEETVRTFINLPSEVRKDINKYLMVIARNGVSLVPGRLYTRKRVVFCRSAR